MDFKYEILEQVLVLKLEQNLIGLNQGPEILDLIDDCIAKNIRLCAVDISKVRYINSSGIGFLVIILTKFRNKEGEVYLINPSKDVKKLLIITKLNAFFNITKTQKEAIKGLLGELKISKS